MNPLGKKQNSAPKICLNGNEIDIWRVSLRVSQDQLRLLKTQLSADERKRAERFHFKNHASRFVVAHGVLRMILARYMNTEPDQLRFSRDENGKPFVLSESSAIPPCFNMSHSAELAIYAVTKDRPVGIDVEHNSTRADVEQLAKRFFSANEYSQLVSLPADQRNETFIKMWTIKEAYLKATGEGLRGLANIEVELGPDSSHSHWSPSIFSLHKDRRQLICGWAVHMLKPAQEYSGCVVVKELDRADSLTTTHLKQFDAALLI